MTTATESANIVATHFDNGKVRLTLTTGVKDAKGREVGGIANIWPREGMWLHSVISTRNGRKYGALRDDHEAHDYDTAKLDAYRRLQTMGKRIMAVASEHGGVYQTSVNARRET